MNRQIASLELGIAMAVCIVGMLIASCFIQPGAVRRNISVDSFKHAQSCSFMKMRTGIGMEFMALSGMRRGFTLLELMIVIIIVGVLATLGVMQYQNAIERSRGVEGRAIISTLRSSCASRYLGDGNTTACTTTNLGIGATTDLVPNACRSSNYFTYGISGNTGSSITFTATRCTASGKSPQRATASTLTLATVFSAGTDTWGGTGGY